MKEGVAGKDSMMLKLTLMWQCGEKKFWSFLNLEENPLFLSENWLGAVGHPWR